MRELINVTMANDYDIYEIITGSRLTIQPDGEYYQVMLNNEIVDEHYNKCDAVSCAKAYANNGMSIVTGYGKYVGRKVWQLPQRLQSKINNHIRR